MQTNNGEKIMKKKIEIDALGIAIIILALTLAITEIIKALK